MLRELIVKRQINLLSLTTSFNVSILLITLVRVLIDYVGSLERLESIKNV